jgi:hypothetical protein
MLKEVNKGYKLIKIYEYSQFENDNVLISKPKNKNTISLTKKCIFELYEKLSEWLFYVH